MVNRICPKCFKEFNKKSNYLSHINKKFDCEQKLNNEKYFANFCQKI